MEALSGGPGQGSKFVALLDLGLPGSNGFEVAQWPRGKPETKDVLLIALSGYGQEEDRRRSERAGFNHHLVKPFDLAVLKELLTRSAP